MFVNYSLPQVLYKAYLKDSTILHLICDNVKFKSNITKKINKIKILKLILIKK